MIYLLDESICWIPIYCHVKQGKRHDAIKIKIVILLNHIKYHQDISR